MKEKRFRVTLVWDSTEVWEVEACDHQDAIDGALLGQGKLVNGPVGYDLQDEKVEVVSA